MAHPRPDQKRGDASAVHRTSTAAKTAAKTAAVKRTADPRWQRTRERLLRVGFELIGEAGAEGVSIDAIIASADISKQTFYNHFSDRDLFTQELWLESRRVFEMAVTRANAGVTDPARRVARGVATYARLAIDDPAHAQFIARTNIRRSVLENANEGLTRDLVDGVAQDRLRLDKVTTAAMFVTGVTWALIAQILASDDLAESVAFCRQTLTMLLRGLGCSGDDAERIAIEAATEIVALKLLD